MSETLRNLAESHGIQTRFRSEMGEAKEIDETAQRALLKALRIDPEGGDLGSFDTEQHAETLRCALPDAVRERRHWGITCQLYALRSHRNLGIGDFEDLARLAELAAAEGAAFVGVNPLHALFLADPGRYSPYSPSTRRFINPFYLALDRLPGGEGTRERLLERDPGLSLALDGDLVEYGRAGRAKAEALRRIFDDAAAEDDAEFARFRERGGQALRAFALFEALSAKMTAETGSSGWHNWPAAFHDRRGEAVLAFERENGSDVRFHEWLQFQCDRQLGEAQRRAMAAGMAIGLYLDFAVGVSPDGADTWADPELTVREARVGSPPDMFNSEGQDWGLAPLSPRALAERSYKPLADSYDALMEHAGALRIDHAMGLARLWWIPQDGRSGGGGYVRTPLGAMVDTVARVSRDTGCIVIGEDLGTVPEGFRPAMERANILSYRVLYFERGEDGAFHRPAHYPELSLACISTHDLATLNGWWHGSDVRLRAETGRQNEADTQRDLAARDRDRRTLLQALHAEHLLSPDWQRRLEAELPERLDEDLAVAIHRYGARTRSLLFAVQMEDMILAERQPNLPGTTDEYPNWRIRSDILLEDLAADERFQATARALREERPETP